MKDWQAVLFQSNVLENYDKEISNVGQACYCKIGVKNNGHVLQAVGKGDDNGLNALIPFIRLKAEAYLSLNI